MWTEVRESLTVLGWLGNELTTFELYLTGKQKFLGGEPREYVESTEMIVSRDIASPQGTNHLGMSHGLLWQEEL